VRSIIAWRSGRGRAAPRRAGTKNGNLQRPGLADLLRQRFQIEPRGPLRAARAASLANASRGLRGTSLVVSMVIDAVVKRRSARTASADRVGRPWEGAARRTFALERDGRRFGRWSSHGISLQKQRRYLRPPRAIVPNLQPPGGHKNRPTPLFIENSGYDAGRVRAIVADDLGSAHDV